MRLDHTGWLVPDLAAARRALDALADYTYSDPCLDARQGVEIVFARDAFGAVLELVRPVDEGSVVAGLMARHGPGAYHACWQAPDLAGEVSRLEAQGFRSLGEPAPAPAFGGRLFVFLFHRALGLVELVEAPTASADAPCAAG